MINSSITVPGAGPSLLQGGKTACLLLHGFTANPEEMQFLAEDLHRRGYTVLNVRLAGHGSQPSDLVRTRWIDWLLSVEDGLDFLSGVSERTVLIGQSMGGMVALTAAARYDVAGVITLSTPYYGFQLFQSVLSRLMGMFGLTAHKHVREHAELGLRREADYPAYARYPVRIVAELDALQKAMRRSLPQVKVPALVVQSRQDMSGSVELERIHAALGSEVKEKLWLENFDHSMVRDEKRLVVFDAIDRFIQSRIL
jgi:carboxylesterase